MPGVPQSHVISSSLCLSALPPNTQVLPLNPLSRLCSNVTSERKLCLITLFKIANSPPLAHPLPTHIFFLFFFFFQALTTFKYRVSLVAQTVKRLSAFERLGFDTWVGKIPWRRKWQPTPVHLPGKYHGQRSLVGCSPWGHKESDTTE